MVDTTDTAKAAPATASDAASAQDAKPAEQPVTETVEQQTPADAGASATAAASKESEPQADAAAPEAAETHSEATANTDSSAAKEAVADKPADEAQPAATEQDTQPAPESDAQKPTAKQRKKKAEPDTPVTEEDISKLKADIEKLSIKNSAELFTVRNQLNRLRKRLEAENPLSQQATELHDVIVKMVGENQAHQEELQKTTAELVSKLEQALEAGQSHDALPTWDRIQGNISNTSGQIRNALQDLATPFKAKIDELRDWKIFAATEKKRELITQMEQLAEQSLSPQDLNKRISKLHAEWKNLGRSNDNEELWKQFKTFSDKAYAPCKEFFKQRKSVMAENLKKRRALCDMLEKELAALDPDNIHVGNINKLLSNTEAEWKSHAPVEQSKIKSLQKRYYDLVNQFRKHRKSSARQHGAQKQALIDQANLLVEEADKRKAIEGAKELQKQWKEIGPSSFKEDKKYWADFRAACDKIFEQRSQQAAQRKQQTQAAESELKTLLQELESLFALGDQEFREAKAQFRTLAQKFNSSISGKLRQTRSKQIERFNELKRKIDNRYLSLPDEKTQALLASLETLDSKLSACEDQLLASKDEAEYTQILESFDDALFDSVKSLADEDLQAALDARRKAKNSKSVDTLNKALASGDKALRKLCVETEIRAGVDSPNEDQSLRMELQLAQLQDGFGQSRPTNKENIAYARKVRLQKLCIGPVSPAIRDDMRKRLDEAVNRLV